MRNGIKSQDPLCAQFKLLRTRLGLSLEQVERKSDGRWKGVVVGSYERGDRHPSVEQARELLAWYGWGLEAVGPGDVVVRAAENAEKATEVVEWLVQYGSHLENTIECPKGMDEAQAIAAHMFDAKVAYRTHHIGPLHWAGGAV